MAALAGADGVAVVLALLEPVVLLQPGEDRLVGLLLRLPGEVAGLLVHAPVGADHGEGLELVVAADLEVGRVVAGRDLERAGAELAARPRSSAITGTRRSTYGTSTSLPIASR